MQRKEKAEGFSHILYSLLSFSVLAWARALCLVSQGDRQGQGAQQGIKAGRREGISGLDLLPWVGQSQAGLTPLGTLSAWWLQGEEGGCASNCLPTRWGAGSAGSL